MTNTVDLSKALKLPPPTPSKWDIIPIHTSDRGTFKHCRRQWGWSSPSRSNLIPKTTIYGVRWPLWFGTGIHYALERYYNPILREDPVVTWEAWANLQWNGGLVTEEEIAEHGFWDRNPIVKSITPQARNIEGQWVVKLVPIPTYQVKGLSELLPDPDELVYQEHLDLGRGMMEFYKTYAQREDNFAVIMTEHTFSVPILNPKTGEPLYAVDTRVMPEDWEPRPELGNDYGPLMEMGDSGWVKQVHARGRQDLIIQDTENGRYGIKDHKTSVRQLDEDYFRHLDLDEQCTTYLWAAEQEAKMYDLPYKQTDFITYQALLKGYPRPPTLTTKGFPSIDRQNESTTAEMYEKCIKENNLEVLFNADEKWQAYYTWLLETGDKRFINRKPVIRNKHQKESCGKRLFYEAVDMLSLHDEQLYPNPSKNWLCINCVFRSPCVMAEDGSDWKALLDDGYVTNYDR